MIPSKQNIDLPEPMKDHVILNLNETTSILIGGVTLISLFSANTYYFNHITNTWTDGPNLKIGRSQHKARVIKDKGNNQEHIVVVGGQFLLPTNTVEILFQGQKTWTAGTLGQKRVHY